jgi:hypothetical protein
MCLSWFSKIPILLGLLAAVLICVTPNAARLDHRSKLLLCNRLSSRQDEAGIKLGTYFAPCESDSACHEGCCAFVNPTQNASSQCVGPINAQYNDSSFRGCGFGNSQRNCNVARVLESSECIDNAVPLNTSDVTVFKAACFVAYTEGISVTAPTSILNDTFCSLQGFPGITFLQPPTGSSTVTESSAESSNSSSPS